MRIRALNSFLLGFESVRKTKKAVLLFIFSPASRVRVSSFLFLRSEEKTHVYYLVFYFCAETP